MAVKHCPSSTQYACVSVVLAQTLDNRCHSRKCVVFVCVRAICLLLNLEMPSAAVVATEQ